MASATKTLGFEEIETGEQWERVQDYAVRRAATLEEDIRAGGIFTIQNAKEHARELHRLLVALDKFYGG